MMDDVLGDLIELQLRTENQHKNVGNQTTALVTMLLNSQKQKEIARRQHIMAMHLIRKDPFGAILSKPVTNQPSKNTDNCNYTVPECKKDKNKQTTD